MIGLAPLRSKLEKALQSLTVLEHDLRDLALAEDADCAAIQARTAVVPSEAPVACSEAPSPSVAQRAQTAAARSCDNCGKGFTPHPQGAHRAKFCSARCRQNAANQRRAAREDAEWRAKTAELVEQHAAEGYITNGTGA